MKSEKNNNKSIVTKTGGKKPKENSMDGVEKLLGGELI